MSKAKILITGLLLATGLSFCQSIKVIQPNSGEKLTLRSDYMIRWSAAGTTHPFKITLWKNNLLVGIVASEAPAGNGTMSFNWKVGNLEGGAGAAPGPGYSIKVKEKTVPVEDMSDAAFQIMSRHDPSTLRPAIKPVNVHAFQEPTALPDLKTEITGYDFKTRYPHIIDTISAPNFRLTPGDRVTICTEVSNTGQASSGTFQLIVELKDSQNNPFKTFQKQCASLAPGGRVSFCPELVINTHDGFINCYLKIAGMKKDDYNPSDNSEYLGTILLWKKQYVDDYLAQD
ncbi:MAG: hypothetical protein RB296_12780 [Acidobacteriota bacterium]|nr:hypothetical protein [Acidobacteriota bacterium]